MSKNKKVTDSLVTLMSFVKEQANSSLVEQGRRIQITDDESLENPKEGIFYTGLVNYEREDRPAPQEPKPPRALNLNIKQYIPRDRSRDYMNIENHPYLGEPEPHNSAANKIEVVEDGI